MQQPMGFMPQLDPAAMQQQPGQQQGGFGGFLQNMTSNPLFLMGAGVLGGQNVGQGLMGGLQMSNQMQQQAYERQRQQAADQRTNEMHPLQKQLLEANVRKANEPPTSEEIREFEYSKRNDGNTGSFMDWLAKTRAMKTGGEFGNNFQIVQGPDGKYHTLQSGKSGRLNIQPMTAPGGGDLTPFKGIEIVGDTAFNKANAQPVRSVGEALSGGKVATETGEAKGKFIAALPKLETAVSSVARKDADAVSDIDEAIGLIDRGGVTSWMGATAKYAKGTDAFRLAEILKSVKARAGFDTLGEIKAQSPTGSALGSTTEKELEFLQAASGSFEQAQDAQSLKSTLSRYRQTVSGRAPRLQRELDQQKQYYGTTAPGLNPAALQQAPAAAGSGTTMRWNPQTMQLEPQ